MLGVSVDGRGFDQESLEATYRRHQFDTLFGERLNDWEGKHDVAPIWRIDWTSELSDPGALDSDFDFRRTSSCRAARAFTLSRSADVGGACDRRLVRVAYCRRSGSSASAASDRSTATTSRQQVGDTLTLLNLEYELGWRHGLRAIGFFDAGRSTLRQTAAAVPLGAIPVDTPWLKGVGWGVARRRLPRRLRL